MAPVTRYQTKRRIPSQVTLERVLPLDNSKAAISDKGSFELNCFVSKILDIKANFSLS